MADVGPATLTEHTGGPVPPAPPVSQASPGPVDLALAKGEDQVPARVTTRRAARGWRVPGIRRSSWKVLRHREFRLYFIGSLGSNLGTWLQNTAQVLLAYQLTRSVFAVGVMISAQFAGSLFLGPWAAVLADRIGGRRMLIVIQVFSAAVAGFIALLQARGQLNEHFLLIGALGLGLAFTFALPVQTALISRLTPSADTEAAMAMNSVSYNAGRALAPAICIAVVTVIGFAWAFALNAISFVIFALILAALRRQTSPQACPAVISSAAIPREPGMALPSHCRNRGFCFCCSWWPRSPLRTTRSWCSARPWPTMSWARQRTGPGISCPHWAWVRFWALCGPSRNPAHQIRPRRWTQARKRRHGGPRNACCSCRSR